MKEISSKFFSFIAATFLTCFLGVTLNAQNSTVLKGTVTDETNAKVTGAQVVLFSRTGLTLTSQTNESGVFRFDNLRSEIYIVEIKASGFAVYDSEDIKLENNQTRELEVTLRIASLNESVVVTATGTLQREDEVAKVINTVTAEDIEAKHTLSLAEDLRGTPGVRIQQQGSPGALTTIRLRGLRNFDTAVLVDGLRVRDAGDINGSALSLITDMAPLGDDRLELLLGSGSSIYGTHAIGGVINMIPEIPQPGVHVTAGFEGGGLATYRERLQLSGGSNKLGFETGVSRLDVRHGIDGDDQYGDTVMSGRVQYNPLQNINITGRFYGTIGNGRVNDNPFALPGAFTSSQQFPDAVAGVTFQPDFNNPDKGRRTQLLVGSGRFTHSVNDRLSYSIAYQRVGSNRRNYNGPAVDPRFATFVPFGDFEFQSINKGTIDTIDGRFNWQISDSNLATFGAEFERESFFQSSQPSFNVFNNTTDRQRTYAIFGQDQLSFRDRRLQIAIGVRAQGYRLRSADRPGDLQARNAESSVTGDGAIAYLFRRSGTKVRGHIGNGFRAPSLFERFGEGTISTGPVRFGDPTLRAEQSISVDGGLEQRLASDKVVFNATYFYTRLQRIITFTGFVEDPLGLGRFSGYINQPGGLARGVETSVEASLWKGADLRAGYTFTNSDRFVTNRGLQPEYVIPENQFGFNFRQRYHSLLINFALNRTGSYLAPVFENDPPFRTAELTFDGYTKGDLFASYERKQTEKVTIVLFGGVENIFNQTYYENGFLAPGAVGRGGVKVKF
ncbi:MAG TPA: TonB-dependent receptor [Pyrinomonadaceae bacterium]|nr:TonB-dependent receptor [Pyrinomonadaceae bacterium]